MQIGCMQSSTVHINRNMDFVKYENSIKEKIGLHLYYVECFAPESRISEI